MKKEYTIGVLIGNANSPHTLGVMEGISQAAKAMNINVLFFLAVHSSYDYDSYFGKGAEEDYEYQLNTIYDYADFSKADALIIAYGSMSIFLNEEEKKGVLDKFRDRPCVLLEERDKTGTAISIIAQNYQGMYMLVEHLVRDHGCRELVYLSGPSGNTDADERRAAVYDVCAGYGIPFDESHIAYGDYSANVEKQVGQLLDAFPRTDALICANDTMADTACRVCFARGLLVGHDLAVTGYDDDRHLAESMIPPLTTVLQNAKDIGYLAVTSALELLNGGSPREIRVPAVLKLRESCGCRLDPALSSGLNPGMGKEDPRILPPRNAVLLESLPADWWHIAGSHMEELLDHILPSDTDDITRIRIREYLQTLLQEDMRQPDSQINVRNGLLRLLSSEFSSGLSMPALMDTFESYLDSWIRQESTGPPADGSYLRNLLLRKQQIRRTIFAHAIKRESGQSVKYQQESWFLPVISRDMICHMTDEKEFYHRALSRLSAMQARRARLYILKEPLTHLPGEHWECPDELYLAASLDESEVCSFAPEERPRIRKGCPDGKSLMQKTDDGAPYAVSVFSLFSGEIQYGILAVEIMPDQLSLFYLLSRQMGNVLQMHQMSLEQRNLRRTLETLVEEIREKNEVLNFISEADPLTGCLNRRGFMEKAVRLNRENEGKKAVLLFADLDHLKEINDCYGHMEGDFSLCHCARMMQKGVGEHGILGRIGGDEFCAMIPGDSAKGQQIAGHIREIADRFNSISEKEYYIEISIGYTEIVCSAELAMTSILSDADRALYSAKKNRRKSVKKF